MKHSVLAFAVVLSAASVFGETPPDYTENLEFVGDPTSFRYSSGNYTARSITDLAVHNGKIFAGYGCWDPNLGPVNMVAIDPVTKTMTDEYVAGTEAVGVMRVFSDGNLYAPAIDCHEAGPNAGRFFVRTPSGSWSAHTDLMVNATTFDVHVFDMIEFDGAMFAAGQHGLARSTDGGTNWTDVTKNTYNGGRCFTLIKCGDELFSRYSQFAPAGGVSSDGSKQPALWRWNRQTEMFNLITNSSWEAMAPGFKWQDFKLCPYINSNSSKFPMDTWHSTPFGDRCLYVIGHKDIKYENAVPSSIFPAFAVSSYVEGGAFKSDRIALPDGTYPIDFTVAEGAVFMLTFRYDSSDNKVEHGVWKSTDGVNFTQIFTVKFQQLMQALEYYNGYFYLGVARLGAQPLFELDTTGLTEKAGSVYRVFCPQGPVVDPPEDDPVTPYPPDPEDPDKDLPEDAELAARAVRIGDTIRFYYDKKSHAQGGAVVTKIPVAGTRTWLDPDEDNFEITNVIFYSSFKSFKPKSMNGWFYYYRALKNVEGLHNIDTSEVTNMSNLFRCFQGNNPNIIELDLSAWDTRNCVHMDFMFARLSGLKTVYVSDKFVVAQVERSEKMFYKCSAITGEKGTKFLDTAMDKTRAKVDGGESDPGYFTYKASGTDPVIVKPELGSATIVTGDAKMFRISVSNPVVGAAYTLFTSTALDGEFTAEADSTVYASGELLLDFAIEDDKPQKFAKIVISTTPYKQGDPLPEE